MTPAPCTRRWVAPSRWTQSIPGTSARRLRRHWPPGWKKKSAVTLIEGAGGLLSPLGEDFDSRDLIAALRATPVIVAPNKLGAVNHVLLTLEALPKNLRSRAKIVLVSSPKPDAAAASNARLLTQFSPRAKIFTLPWLGGKCDVTIALKTARVRKTLAALAEI